MKDSLNYEILKQQLNSLQIKIDSVNQLSSIKQMQYELYQKQDVITQVNDFYDSAWLKLIIVISVLGILVPIIAQYFQRKNLNDLTDFIRNQMNDSLEFKIEELKNFNKVEIEKTIIELKENISLLEKKNDNVKFQMEGSLFFLQARSHFLEKKLVECAYDYIRATYNWLEAKDIKRTAVSLSNVVIATKSLTSKNEVEKLEILIKNGFDMSINDIIKYFKDSQFFTAYEKHLGDFITEIDRLEKIVV